MLEKYVENEYIKLKNEYNSASEIEKYTINFRNKKFFNDFRRTINTDRRGEVGFFLKRKNGKYVVVRSKKYPKNIYRIPTGGIGFTESVIDALYREVKEELGVEFEIESFKGIVEYTIKYKEEVLKFYSYLFEISEVSGNLIEDATEDEITGYREIDIDELKNVAKKLSSVEGSWKDWCSFRVKLIDFYLKGEKDA